MMPVDSSTRWQAGLAGIVLSRLSYPRHVCRRRSSAASKPIMFKFALHLFLMAILSLGAAFQLVDKGLNAFFSPKLDDLTFRAMRGEVHSLHKELDSVAPAERALFLRENVLPHYGAELRLLADAEVRLGEHDRSQLAHAGFLMRDEYSTFLIPLPGEPKQWLELRLPGDDFLDRMLTWSAWALLTLLMATALFVLWALPVWRDMDALRNAALQMGQGDLGKRVHLSRISGLRHIGESFNYMAERIATLIEGQRNLTNAVSHELRTPLARLSFEIDLVDRGEAGSQDKSIFQDMRADVAELENMVAELLVYARLEHPSEEIVALETVDASDWLAKALAMIQHQAAARNVRCVVHDGHPSQVRLHPRYMSRALLNLLQNAVRYAHEKVEIELKLRSDGDFVLRVDDDGPGILVADRDRIFEPFIRLDESRDRGTGGVGLGLAIVHRVATSHQGSVRISDSPLGGARFVLQWPARLGLPA